MFGFKLLRVCIWLASVGAVHAADSLPLRHLLPARNPHPLSGRDLGLTPSLDDNHVFYSEYDSFFSSQLNAKIRLEPHLPTIVIDDVPEHFSRLNCQEDVVYVHFENSDQLVSAEASWSDHDSFILVTSQPGCAAVGDHQAYTITTKEIRMEEHVIALSGRRNSLKSCNKKLHVSIEASKHSDYLRRDVFPRQDTPAPPPTSISAQPPSTPVISPTATSVTGDLSWSYAGVVFPPEGLLGDALQAVSNIPDTMEFSCVDCNTAGTIELSAANFTMVGDDDFIDEFNEVQDIYENGELTFIANGVKANFSLELAFLPGFTVSVFAVKVPSIPIGGFKLGSLIEVGPQLDLTFPFNIQLNSPVNITSGFSLTVPDKSEIRIDINDFANSSVTGFQDTQITPQPFNMDAPNLSFSFLTGFQPQINLAAGAQGSDYDITGQIGVFFDIPQLNTTVNYLTGVSNTCDPLADGSDTSFNAINVLSSVVIDGGVRGGITIDTPVFNPDDPAREVPLASATVATLPTQCLTFDPTGGVLVPANPEVDSADQGAAKALRPGVWSAGLLAALAVGMFLL